MGNEGSNFLRGGCGKSVKVRVRVKVPHPNLKMRDKPSILKDNFFSRTGPYNFTNFLNFFTAEINKPLPAPVYCAS